jgi:hypothetical protein
VNAAPSILRNLQGKRGGVDRKRTVLDVEVDVVVESRMSKSLVLTMREEFFSGMGGVGRAVTCMEEWELFHGGWYHGKEGVLQAPLDVDGNPAIGGCCKPGVIRYGDFAEDCHGVWTHAPQKEAVDWYVEQETAHEVNSKPSTPNRSS